MAKPSKSVAVMSKNLTHEERQALLNTETKLKRKEDKLKPPTHIYEAKDSSEIENIITTHDEIFRAMPQESYPNLAAKEVVNHRSAIWHGYELMFYILFLRN